MKRIRNYRDIEHQIELVEIQREVKLDKLQQGLNKVKNGLLPSLVSFSVKSFFNKKKKRKNN